MKSISYPIRSLIALATSSVFCNGAFSASQYDVNLNGGANFTLNNANNNKLTTPLKNFSPITVPSGQLHMLPLATPPVTSTVTNVFGGWKNVDIVDPGYTNAVEAKAAHQREGTYVGTLPEVPQDDQPVQADDIEKFLDGYHSYLKDVGAEWGHSPATYANKSQPEIDKDSRLKKSSELPAENKNSVELLANQQKLSIDDTSASEARQKQEVH
jgi:hypothetical protein